MTLYMAVTPDKYELPMLIAESKAELARLSGCTGRPCATRSMGGEAGERAGSCAGMSNTCL